MKRGLFSILFIVVISTQVLAVCNIDISMLNQDPYPAVPGENVKLVFQITTSGTDCSGTIPVSFIEKYPFTLDPSSEKIYNIPTNIYARDYSSNSLAPFTIRVDKEALDGETPLEIQYGNAIKKFSVNIDDVRADFEVFVEDYDPITDQITFEIQNIAGSDANAVTVEIPEQDGLTIVGPNKQNIGSLSSNDDTTSDFKLKTNNDKIDSYYHIYNHNFIIKEKISADHLLYVSLKYTKTCDVILNLIARWKSLIENSFDGLIQVYVDSGKIPMMPNSPKQRIEFMKKYFSKMDSIQEIIPLYIFFKRIPDSQKSRECEFRKNVTLKIKMGDETHNINVEKLSEYSSKVDKFIDDVKSILID